MRLIIDADKIEYMWQQDRNGKFHDGVTLESIVDNTPTVNVNDLIVKEFEKLKAEFEEIEDSDYINGLILPAWKVYEIIDNHISELKGENNDICSNTRRKSKS